MLLSLCVELPYSMSSSHHALSHCEPKCHGPIQALRPTPFRIKNVRTLGEELGTRERNRSSFGRGLRHGSQVRA
ncbi:hypothetical protein LINGRAHAP2_LOCUS32419 [Linum grandiflorum]